ncbi:MAG: outer membrane lipoprotein carrier protein LolA [Planctomycetes bacterium]|nr:outer membrane lipoprotein carrier protein LolA [Planctomycetota bacterium]
MANQTESKTGEANKIATPEEPPAPDPDVDRILRLTEAAGDKVEKLAANFDYDEYETLLDDREFYEGRIVYRKPNRVFMEFTKGSKQSFRFDGRVFVDDRPDQKVRHIYPLRKPTEPEVEDLDVDKVPFPLPFGQKRDKVLRNFEVKYGGKQPLGPWAGTSKKAKATDTKECEKLTLIPKPHGPLARDYQRMEFWIDPESGLPAQVRMIDKSDRILTVRFSDLETNDKVDAPDRIFEEQPLPGGWDRFLHE